MKIKEHLDKNNLHHAYLIEGARDEITAEIKNFLESLGIKTTNNPDFYNISIDNFKIEEALDLRAMSGSKGFTSVKKIFMICANSFSLDAQNVLLKMFEEPKEDTHFFLVVPDINSLLKTLVSRFYVIYVNSKNSSKEVEEFIKMSLSARINFLKDFLKENEETEDIIQLDSARSKSLKFLNDLESAIHSKLLKNSEWCGSQPVIREGLSQKNSLVTCVEHFFKVREFLRMPGSSTKTLMESVALVVPEKI